MPTDYSNPGYYDEGSGGGGYWVYGADSPDEAKALLSTGEYGLEVGTINGEDYVSILPIDELESYDPYPDYSDFGESSSGSEEEEGGEIPPMDDLMDMSLEELLEVKIK